MAIDTLSVAGKVAIVTGSGRENGIGAAIARGLARNGAAVTINHVSEGVGPRAERLAESIRAAGGKATVVRADVSTADGAKEVAKKTMEAFGVDYIDILVNNAAAGDLHSTLNMSQEEIDKIFQVDTFGPIHMIRAVVPHIRPGGRIINISTIAVKMGVGASSMYCAAKAAADSLTQSWAQEFGRSHGITVNSVAPGPVPTDMSKDIIDKFASIKDITRAADRYGTPEDIADIALWVASEKSRWLTGQFLSASGGATIV